ncbi:glycosyl hydrolase family 28-related protein [Bradyrhizobium ottawaense]|uniref:glycosyl hydrolase family 28-related protein n=1 Tax=Bradyrhizobium ottawaense TaxID=931866 RepID=UPI0035173878
MKSDQIAVLPTIEAFRKQKIEALAIYVGGYESTGDGGEGLLLRAGSNCTDDSVLHYRNEEGTCYVRAQTDGRINVKWAGARGDGTHDDTNALLAAHSLLASVVEKGATARLVYPAGTYLTTKTLPLPGTGSGWELVGEGMPTVLELSDNTPIMRLTIPPSGHSHKWRITGFTFRYKNHQPSTNGNAVAIALGSAGNASDGIYDFEIDRIIFANGWRGISVDTQSYSAGHTCPIWGWFIKDVTSYTGMTGATIWLDTLKAGSPRGNLINFYAQNKNATEPALTIKGMSQFYASNLEFNQGQDTNLYLQNRGSVIDSMRFESVKLTHEGASLASFGDGQVIIRNLEVQYFANNTRVDGSFLSMFRGNLTLENLWTFGTVGKLTPGWNVAKMQNGATFEFKGSWRRFEDGEIKLK